jgi:hypothetical protein
MPQSGKRLKTTPTAKMSESVLTGKIKTIRTVGERCQKRKSTWKGWFGEKGNAKNEDKWKKNINNLIINKMSRNPIPNKDSQ